MKYNKIVSFDFDDTLFFTPDHITGKKEWEQKTGLDWPYNGWWSKPETLNVEIFNIPVNPYVYKKYLEAITEDDTLCILATGRLDKSRNGKYPGKLSLRPQVEDVLRTHNIEFGEHVYLNPGMDTYHFKTNLFSDLINKYNPNTFVMYDDRHEHLKKFPEWAKTQPCVVEIIDVTQSEKKPLIINK